MNEDIELLMEFVVESRDSLDELDAELVALETDPSNADALSSVFRTVHSIKGTAGFFGLAHLEAVAHAGENLLSSLRAGTVQLERVRTTLLLAVCDAIRSVLDHLEAHGREADTDFEILVDALVLANEDRGLPAAQELLDIHHGKPMASNRPADEDDTPTEIDEEDEVTEVYEPPMPAAVPPPPPAPPAPPAPSPPTPSAAPAELDSRIKVDVGLLDELMNLVGELVLARNQHLQHASASDDTGLTATSQRLDQITTELQESVMKTRMQPIDKLWTRYPRVVRDLSLSVGKQVTLKMEGRQTELDKSILEAVADPLTHLVRNAVDHGIEAPDLRAVRGKPPAGTIHLRAFHEGGRVNIEIADDGGGIDPEAIKQKAVEKGLITADDARGLTEHQAINLLFLPGLSTASEITNISGRGVGMDVVRSNVEKIGGSVDVDSRQGVGTTIRIRIPLTLAIIPALVVGARGERFAVPQVNLQELVRIDVDDAAETIERIQQTPVFRLRGQLLSLIDLGEILELAPTGEVLEEINIVILQADDRQFGLLVDSIHDTEEIVVKPLGRELKGIAEYAGATIMGDGRVALILDVGGLAARSHVEEGAARLGPEVDDLADDGPAAPDAEMLLVFRAGPGSRMALPLRSVARLEEIAPARIERAGDRAMVQYRGEILPLVDLGRHFGGAPLERDDVDLLQVVVHASGQRHVGFIVEAIEDVVRHPASASGPSSRRGVLSTAVIQDRLTELLDADAIVEAQRGGGA